MEYEVQLAPLDKSNVTPHGISESLCTKCCSPDCTNPIEERLVSIVGIIKKARFYIINESTIRQVVACKGFVDDELSPMGG